MCAVRHVSFNKVLVTAAFILQFALFGTAGAQTYSVLHHFAGADGDTSHSGVVVAGSSIYGTTMYGGANNRGAIFRLNTDGTNYSVLHSFSSATTNGSNAWGGLTLSGSNLYGTTELGGANNKGAVFSISTAGSGFTLLQSFNGANGSGPASDLSLNGTTLYGTTSGGGATNNGVLYSVSTTGTGYTNLHSFDGTTGGQYPDSKPIIGGTKIYGTTLQGGSPAGNSIGTIYSSNLDGSNFATIYSFSHFFTHGYQPRVYGGLKLIGSTLYGTANTGGSGPNQNGTLFALNTDGSNFRVLHTFVGGTDGSSPQAGLVQVGDILYGTTTYGGALGPDNFGAGTIYQINTDGTGYKTIFRFSDTDGANPFSALTYSNGILYGATADGGTSDKGVVFALQVPEPSSAIMIIIGSLAAAIVRRRRMEKALNRAYSPSKGRSTTIRSALPAL